MNIYELSRNFWDWSFENPDKIKPVHSALYFFAIEHCNRLGWKEKFGFPTTMAMEATGIKSYNTYIYTLKDLVSFGFVMIIEKSKNQYSANIIALSNFNKAVDKALDKAMLKHIPKQDESIVQSTSESIDSIDIPIYNNTIIPYTLLQKENKNFTEVDSAELETSQKKEKSSAKKETKFSIPNFEEVSQYCLERNNGIDARHFIDFYESKNWMIGKNKMKDWKASVRTWERNSNNNQNQNKNGETKTEDRIIGRQTFDTVKSNSENIQHSADYYRELLRKKPD
ncbi:hypothetical protein [Flavobacterium sp. JP2137]|uniref:hypothetical protein n=1 Tax=Flavobacterium sp. JP2137 TaxID=3414510 RepID=UPI003D3005A6